MNISSNYINVPDNIQSTIINREESDTPVFTEGQIIEGRVTRAADKIDVDFRGHEMTFSKEAIPTAKEGEIRQFKVMKVSADSIVLKDLGVVKEQTDVQICKFTYVDTGLSALVQDFREVMGSEEEKDPKKAVDRMSNRDYVTLKQEGFSIEDYEAERLIRALERIKTGLIAKEQAVNEFRETLKKELENTEETGRNNIGYDSALRKMIVMKLENADLPITETAVNEIEKAVSLSGETMKMGEDAYAYLIARELPVTIDNIYRALHCGQLKRTSIEESTWKQLKPEAEYIITQTNNDIVMADGKDAKRVDIEDAKWLIEYDLPLTKENLKLKNRLENLKNDYSIEEAVQLAVKQFENGGAAGDAILLNTEVNEAVHMELLQDIESYSRINDAAINIAVRRAAMNDMQINLLQLTAAQHEADKSEHPYNVSEMSIEGFTAKLKLEEIRLKLTTQSAHILYAKGINISTDSLTRIVEGLREQEKQYYSNLNKEIGAPDTQEAGNLCQQTADSIMGLKSAPVAVLAATFSQRSRMVLSELSTRGIELRYQALRAGESYEALWTAPRTDLGDSIQKAFRNVDNLLEETGSEITEANRRAVRILGYNRLDINKANILNMKFYDAKVNNLIDSMQPAVTAELIKKGINPLERTVDELTEDINSIKKELGYTPEEKYSEYLVRLEGKSGISTAEREAYIGIYRLLYNIEKSDGAVVGAVIAAGKELSLKNLLTESRTGRTKGIDRQVDEKTGEIGDTSGMKNSITEQIYSGYHALKAGQLLDKITPDTAAEVINNPDYSDISLERLEEKLAESINKQAEQIDRQEQDHADEIREVYKKHEVEISFLKVFGVSDSVNNIKAAEALLSTDRREYPILSEVPDTQGELTDKYLEAIDERLKDSEEYFTQIPQAADAMSICEAVNRLKLMGELGRRECYSFELREADRAIGVNLTVIRGNRNRQGKIVISLNSGTDNISAELNVSDRQVKGLIISDNKGNKNRISEAAEDFSRELLISGFEPTAINTAFDDKEKRNYTFRLGEIRRETAVTGNGENLTDVTDRHTETRELYNIAKQFIGCFKEVGI